MNISVVGASGDIGREVVAMLIETGAMDRDATLQLVGRPEGQSASFLHGLVSDLLDAHSEKSPRLEVVLEAEAIQGDLVIFCAGQTVPTDPHQVLDRSALAERNAPVFERYAKAIAQTGKAEQIVIIVSNPVELAVHIFSKYIDPARVIGMGAFLDTIRFRREIAEDLGIRRQRVRGIVIGQHGPGMVPLWSSVGALGFNNEQGLAKLEEIRHRNRMPAQDALAMVRELLQRGEAREALDRIQQFPPDLRVVVEPFISHLTGAKTRLGTSEIVLRMVNTIALGTEVLIACQAKVTGEFLGVHSVIGVPVLLNNQGIAQIYPLDLWDEEKKAFQESAMRINEQLARY
jgi:malate dehydrogenase